MSTCGAHMRVWRYDVVTAHSDINVYRRCTWATPGTIDSTSIGQPSAASDATRNFQPSRFTTYGISSYIIFFKPVLPLEWVLI